MTTNYTIKHHKVQLNGNKLTGDTYPIKSWIKDYLNGKWDAEAKAWIVDLGQVAQFAGLAYGLMPDNSTPAAETKSTKSNNWYRINEHGERELNDEF